MRYKLLLIFGIVFCLLINYSYATGEFINMSLAGVYGSNSTTVSGGRGITGDPVQKVLYLANVNDQLTKLNYTDPTAISFISYISDSDGSGTLDQIRRASVDYTRGIFYAVSFFDNATSLYNFTPATPTVLSYVTSTSGTNSLDGAWGVDWYNSAGTNYLVTGSALDDNIVVWNVTAASSTPVYVANFAKGDNPCSIDNVREIHVTDDNSILFVASLTDATITALSIAANGSLTCLSNYTDSAPPYSVDNPQDFFYEESTKLMYVTPAVDKELTIINWSVPTAPVAVGNITITLQGVTVDVVTIGSDKFAFIGSNGTGGITVINVTNPALPRYFSTFNTGSGTCGTYTYVYDMYVDTNHLYTIGNGCVHAIKLYDLITNAAPVMVSSRISPTIAYWNDTLMGYCNATDADNDTLYFNYTWIDSEEVVYNNVTPTIYSPGIEYQISNLSTGLAFPNIINFTCIAGDGTAESSVINYNITIAAKAPVPNVRITPDPAYSGGNLSGYCNTTDDPTKVVFFNYSWYKDGSLIYNGYYDGYGFGHPVGEEILLHTTENITSGNYTFSCNASDFYSHSATINTSILVTTLTDISFSISYPSTGCSNGLGCSTGGCTACTYCAFNFSSNNDDFQDCQGQISDNTSFYRFTNTGNVLITLIGSLNQSLNSALTLKYGYNPLLGINYNLTNSGATYNNTGQWYSFDTGDYMTRTNFNHIWTEYTESVWIYPTSSNANNIILDISLAGIYNNRTYTSRLQTGYIRFSFSNTTSSVYYDSTSTVPLNTWTHVLASYNGTNITIYLNSVLSKTGGLTGGMITNGRTLFIGASGDLSTKWNGSIDDVRIFNRSLSSSEITQVYNNQSVTTDLVASWDFGDLDNFNISTTTFVSGLGVSAYKDVYLVGTVSAGLFSNYSYSLQVNSSES